MGRFESEVSEGLLASNALRSLSLSESDEPRRPKPPSVILTERRQIPEWSLVVDRAIDRLMNLEPNWNSYSSVRIQESKVRALYRSLMNLLDSQAVAPTVVPTASGGVQAEWHRKGCDLEIEAVSFSRLVVRFDCDARDESFEVEITGDYRPVASWFAEVSAP